MDENRKQHILNSKYFFLLASLLALLIFEFVEPTHISLKLTVTGIFFLVFATVIYIIKKDILYFYSAIVLAIVASAANLYEAFFYDPTIDMLSKGLFVFYSIMAIYLISREVFSTKAVTRDTVIGSICIYFFIGISYAIIYSMLAIVEPNAFLSTQTNSALEHSANFFYFSFITLTTVGFGDIQPVTALAKFIVTLESITGIFYLAVFVSRLIGQRKQL